MKRKLFLAMFLSLFLLPFTSCGKKNTKTGSMNVREKGDVVLTFAMWGSPEENKAVEKVLVEFQKENAAAKKKDPSVPLIGLKVITVDSLSYSDKLMTMFSGNTPPDVFYLHIQDFYKYASKDNLLSLDDFIDEDTNFNLSDFYPQLIKAFTYGGHIYGVPKDWTDFVLYYNKDLFKQYGLKEPSPSWTWDDFLKAAQTLTIDSNKDGVIDRYGFTIETWSDWYTPWLLQNGGGIFDKDGNWIFAKGKYLEANAGALDFLSDLIYKYKVSPTVTTSKQIGNYESFMDGRIAMCIYGRWAELKFKNIKGFKWGYAVLPHKKKRASTLVTVSLAIAKKTKHPEAAWRLLKFLTSKKGQIFTAENGLAVPARRSLVNSDHYLKAPEVLKYQPQLAMDSPDQDPFIQELSYSYLPPSNPSWLEVRQKMDEQLEAVFLGKVKAKQKILELDGVVNEILASTGQEEVQGGEE